MNRESLVLKMADLYKPLLSPMTHFSIQSRHMLLILHKAILIINSKEHPITQC